MARKKQTPDEREEAVQEEAAQERDGFPNPCVYCGPSVKGVARQYTTYHGGLPDALRDFLEEHPAARALVAAPAAFTGMRKRLETPGTAEARAYQQVKAELRA